MGKYNIISDNNKIEIEFDGSQISHRIHLNEEVYSDLKRLEDELSKKMGAKVTPSMVIKSLINEHENLNEIKKGLEESQTYLKKMLELSLSQRQVFIGSGMQMSSAPELHPPSPPKPILPKKVLPTDDPDLKKNIVNEMKNIFTIDEQGHLMKASEILKQTKAFTEKTLTEEEKQIAREKLLKSEEEAKKRLLERESKGKAKLREETPEERSERLKVPQGIIETESDEIKIPKLSEETETSIATQLAFLESLISFLNENSLESSIKELQKEEYQQ